MHDTCIFFVVYGLGGGEVPSDAGKEKNESAEPSPPVSVEQTDGVAVSGVADGGQPSEESDTATPCSESGEQTDSGEYLCLMGVYIL